MGPCSLTSCLCLFFCSCIHVIVAFPVKGKLCCHLAVFHFKDTAVVDHIKHFVVIDHLYKVCTIFQSYRCFFFYLDLGIRKHNAFHIFICYSFYHISTRCADLKTYFTLCICFCFACYFFACFSICKCNIISFRRCKFILTYGSADIFIHVIGITGESKSKFLILVYRDLLLFKLQVCRIIHFCCRKNGKHISFFQPAHSWITCHIFSIYTESNKVFKALLSQKEACTGASASAHQILGWICNIFLSEQFLMQINQCIDHGCTFFHIT